MRHTGALAMIVIAVAAGLGAVVIASRWLSHQGASIGGKQRVVVAAADIELGSRLAPAMLTVVEWPADTLPKGTFSDPKELDTRVVRASVLRGEPVLEAKLAPVGAKGGLSAVVAEGKRAMTVRVNDVVGVAGFALPGNYVDIIVSTQEDTARGGNRDQTLSKIVLEHILVLAVAQEAGRDETKPKVVNAVTLEVTPEQAEKLDLARSVGTLSLVLRNQADPAPAGTAGATKTTLLGVQAQAPAPKPQVEKAVVRKAAPARVTIVQPAPRHCVEVITGIEKTLECF